MQYKNKRIAKVIGINFLITGGLLLLPELVLSKYFLRSPALNIPHALIDYSKTFDTSKIENETKTHIARYSRNSNGYRPFKVPNNDKKIVLTIGGSTTDQRYIDDNKTWQRVIEKLSGVSVINGGVDGHSSYGHLFSINNWYSKTLPIEDVKKIIFYIGVNDVRFSNTLDAARGNTYDSPSILLRVKNYFLKRSFLCSILRHARAKFNVLTGIHSITPEGVLTIGHGDKNPAFLSVPIKSTVRLRNIQETSDYKELFKNLLITATQILQHATIYVVQQQDPKCIFNDNGVFIRVSVNEFPKIDNYCSALASIYITQEQVINELNKVEITLIKMYKENPIPDKGFYDGIHTNSQGSHAIGNYLKNQLYGGN